jgi:HEAT repeat protein
VEVRLAAIQALGRIGNEAARECLGHCLESDSEAVRRAAEAALAEIAAGDTPLSYRI